MAEPIAGKFLLEILTRGMYSNPLHIYREYIQNSVDSIDKAISAKLLNENDAEIHIYINSEERSVVIRDNGIGVPRTEISSKLYSIGASDKNISEERGFRGIGRLGGLAYADKVQFVTSAVGETTKTTMTCDCIRLQQLLLKSNNETSDVMETFKAICSSNEEQEDADAHYFEVHLLGITDDKLLDNERVLKYIAETAPIDFDSQLFSLADKIRKYFAEKNFPITCYKIFRDDRKLQIYKVYSDKVPTGGKKSTRGNDSIHDIEFVYEKASDGKPLYIGWLAKTDFSAMISDVSIQGIRLRKGNILVGNNTTFTKFFPSEGYTANRMFAGEIHVLHDGIIPNSQRDDFEPSSMYDEMRAHLTEWANSLNKKYRRGTSVANSAVKKLDKFNNDQKQLENRVNSGAISSDEKREQMSKKLNEITHKREAEEKKVRNALKRGTFDKENSEIAKKKLSESEAKKKEAIELQTKIINADYATKNDLSSSYNRAEHKLYEKIIAIIDKFFEKEPQTANALRERIKSTLNNERNK